MPVTMNKTAQIIVVGQLGGKFGGHESNSLMNVCI